VLTTLRSNLIQRESAQSVGHMSFCHGSALDCPHLTGVLTKPDRIPQGEEMSWIRLVQNEVEPLVNNWYCVKQPSSQAIKDGIDWAGARRQEREFFASTKPWCNLDSYCQSFLCTTRLTERLSTILAELIAKRCDIFSVPFSTLMGLYADFPRFRRNYTRSCR